jgi:hypothetical protein
MQRTPTAKASTAGGVSCFARNRSDALNQPNRIRTGTGIDGVMRHAKASCGGGQRCKARRRRLAHLSPLTTDSTAKLLI